MTKTLQGGPVLISGAGTKAYFIKHGQSNFADLEGDRLWLDASWPLGEFDELVEFVNEHRENLKRAELAPEDEVPGGDK